MHGGEDIQGHLLAKKMPFFPHLEAPWKRCEGLVL